MSLYVCILSVSIWPTQEQTGIYTGLGELEWHGIKGRMFLLSVWLGVVSGVWRIYKICYISSRIKSKTARDEIFLSDKNESLLLYVDYKSASLYLIFSLTHCLYLYYERGKIKIHDCFQNQIFVLISKSYRSNKCVEMTLSFS